jgi:alpha,alpha-trehalose-phosphate synthase [UDP-forming]
MRTRQDLHDLIQQKMSDFRFIVVSNREPFIHRYVEDRIEAIRPASGMAVALDPIMDASGGVWIAHGGGEADGEVVDEHDRIWVPPDDPRYLLRRVWLTKEQERGYYYGLSNEALWPLCHIAFTAPVFRAADWETYREVNEMFAEAVLQEARGEPTIVFIQDFHFALLPRMLREADGARLIIAHFWHIPWPNREVFRVFPWKEDLLHGLLGSDLLGFHIGYHCQNFLDTVDRTIEARVDLEHSEVICGGKTTVVRAFPISIDFEKHDAIARTPEVDAAIGRWKRRLGRGVEFVGVGLERLDYTKGIPHRFRAIDRLLAEHPEYRGKLVFVQGAVPSRSHIPAYQRLDNEADALAEEINYRWQDRGWKPILFLKEHHSPVEMIALHRLSRFCVVSSLHDGMNLVAKEYAASRTDEDGVLILSQFTGAARELSEALLVNPFAEHEVADAIHAALTMPEEERSRRMRSLREEIQTNNVYRWAERILAALLKLDFPEELT